MLTFKFNKVIITYLSLVLFGCGLRTNILLDGKTKVPAKKKVYSNKAMFKDSLLSIIDTSVIYEEYDLNKKIFYRLDSKNKTKSYGVLRFYSNGNFNQFLILQGEAIDSNTFNPIFSGLRGVYYLEKGEVKFDLFGAKNSRGWIGKLPGNITVSGDTLFVYYELARKTRVFVKRNIQPKFLVDGGKEW